MKKILFAFGDSIVNGHTYDKEGLAEFVAAEQNLELYKFAVNGATVMDIGYEGGQILRQMQLKNMNRQPDFILFDGGTNDAEYLAGGQKESVPKTAGDFRAAFAETVTYMKKNWKDAKIIYVAAHRMGSRDGAIQDRLHGTTLSICRSMGVTAADVYRESGLDTSIETHRVRYTFDRNNEEGLPGTGGSGTHPNLEAIRIFYLPVINRAFENLNKTE